MEIEQRKTNGKRLVEEKLSLQLRDDEDINKSESILNTPTIDITLPQRRQERSLSHSCVDSVLVRVEDGLQIIPEKSRLTRSPATSVYSEKRSTASIHFNVPSTMMTNEINTELSPAFNFHSVICGKCMMKHVVASIQPTPGNFKTWQGKNVKRKDLLKMEICKLVGEVKVIADDILAKKRKWIFVNDDTSAKLKTELIKINKQLADYINVNRNRNNIKSKMRELKIKNDLNAIEMTAAKIIVEQQNMKEKLREEKTTEFRKNNEKIWDLNLDAKDEFVELIDKRKELQHKIKKEQKEIDLILAEKVKLEKQIELMQPKIIKNEDEIKNEQENLINTENDEKFLFDQRMQDYFKNTAVEQIKDENKDEMKKFETDSKEIQFEQMIKYNSLTKEIHERITSFENKLDETVKAQNDLEKFIKENRELIDLESLEKKVMESIKRYHILFQNRIKSMS